MRGFNPNLYFWRTATSNILMINNLRVLKTWNFVPGGYFPCGHFNQKEHTECPTFSGAYYGFCSNTMAWLSKHGLNGACNAKVPRLCSAVCMRFCRTRKSELLQRASFFKRHPAFCHEYSPWKECQSLRAGGGAINETTSEMWHPSFRTILVPYNNFRTCIPEFIPVSENDQFIHSSDQNLENQ